MLRRIGQVLAKAEHGSPLRVLMGCYTHPWHRLPLQSPSEREDPRRAELPPYHAAHSFTQTRLLPPGRLARLAPVFLPIQSVTHSIYTSNKNTGSMSRISSIRNPQVLYEERRKTADSMRMCRNYGRLR